MINSNANNNKSFFAKMIPILLVFFAMGFVDASGVASNYLKKDFALSDSVANLFASMVFLWFLLCSIPTGLLMNKIGRKNTVLISLGITLASLTLPLIEYNLTIMMISFSLLGIGNAMMQVSLNPLVSNVVSGKQLSSYMTLGQFMKAICALLGPIIANSMALYYQNWRLLFAIFLVQGVIATLILAKQNIQREEVDKSAKTSGFVASFSLLKNSSILLFFIAIMCHVGIDVGVNVSAPKILMEKLGIDLNMALRANMIYFLFRTISSFVGAIVMSRYSVSKFFLTSMVLLFGAMGSLYFVDTKIGLYICFAVIGFGNANIFPIMLSTAMNLLPKKKNELSALMVMGVFGGTIFPLIMGVASDLISSQMGSVFVMLICISYLLVLTRKIR